MRRKKHKTTRRAVRFYKINFGFRPPYKVLLDGNFVHAVDSLKRGDCKEEIIKLLGDPARVFTTKCVTQELRELGKEYSAARQQCKRYALHHCGHEDTVSAAECLASQVQNGNHEHFFVATQDRSLQKRIIGMPGGAVLFASVNGLQMEMPSDAQKRVVQSKDRASLGISEVEKRSRVLQRGSDDDEDGGERRQRRPDDDASAAAAFRRNRAKGPNPLSMRKKQKKQPMSVAAAVGQEQQEVKAKRQRRKKKKEAEGAGNSE